MNFKKKAIESVVLAVGVVGMSVITLTSGTSVTTGASAQTATPGRTAGVVLSLNNLEEESMDALNQVGVEQIKTDKVTSSDISTEMEPEAVSETETELETETVAVAEPVLSEEEQLWQNRLMADVDNQMNVRAEATAESDIVGRLRKGDVAEVIEVGEEWTHIQSGNVDGYVKNSYCVFGQEALEYAKENVDTRATVTGNGLRVRSEASTETGAVVAAVSKGTVLIVDTEAEVPEGWVAVGYTGKTRFVSEEFVDVNFATTEAITIEEEREIARKKAEEEAKRKAAQTTEIIVVQREAYDATTDEILLLAALIQCEAGGESYEGKVAVGAVVMNRVRSSKYPNSISEVIYSPKQFTPAGNGKVDQVLANGPKESCIQAAQEAVNGVDNTNGAVSFRQTKTGHAGLVIGGHVFFGRM